MWGCGNDSLIIANVAGTLRWYGICIDGAILDIQNGRHGNPYLSTSRHLIVA